MRAALKSGCCVLAFVSSMSRAFEDRHSWPYSAEIVDDGGNALPTFERGGQSYVLGTIGQRYRVRIRKSSGARIEVVASVDGRDVIDGRFASWVKRGYIVDAYGQFTIDGYRLNQDSVAAFRFSSVSRSYASQMGNARDVGVIGLAIFPERSVYRDELSFKSDMSSEGVPAPPQPKSEASAREGMRAQRPGLGTEFGEQHVSQVRSVPFHRASSTPAAVLNLRYDDRPGLAALGIDFSGYPHQGGSEPWLRATAEPFRQNGFAEPPPGWRR